MAQLRWLTTSGSTATLLVSGTADITLTAYKAHHYALNHDADHDGVPDSVRARFIWPGTDASIEYGIFLGNSPDFAVVIDRSHDSADITYPHNRYPGLAVAYLGSSGKDVLDAGFGQLAASGNDGDDVIRATAGDDVLNGDAGNDRLFGRGGRDLLSGGSGDDLLSGGTGRDVLTGGEGADIFVFDPRSIIDRDQVRDFSAAQHDRIDLSAFAAGLTFVGDAAFSGEGAEIRARVNDDRLQLIFDLDGDGAADGSIILQGATTISTDDLILPASPV